MSRVIYKMQTTINEQEEASRSFKKDQEELKDRIHKIEEVYLNEGNTDTMNKLEELAKAGGTIDAATLMESLKELKRELKVTIVDQGKTLRDQISTAADKQGKSMKSDFGRLREALLEQLEDEQEAVNKKLASQRAMIQGKADQAQFVLEIDELSRMIAQMGASSASPE